MSVGDRVVTQHGPGLIVGTEFYNRLDGGITRYCVKLDVQRFFYPIACYWSKELTLEKESVKCAG